MASIWEALLEALAMTSVLTAASPSANWARAQKLYYAKVGPGMGLRKGHQAVTDKLERADPVTESQSDGIRIKSNILGCTDPRQVGFSDGSAGQFFELICGRSSRGHAEVVKELLLQWRQVCEVRGVQVTQRITT